MRLFKWTIVKNSELKDIEIELENKTNEIIELEKDIEQWREIAETQEIEINTLENLKSKDLELLYKYPSRKVSWNARSLPFSTTKCKVPVNVLITSNDPYILEDLRNWKLINTGEDFETLIPKIYKKIKAAYYKYAYDKVTWDTNEVWEFPFELREKGFNKGFDCDSWANFQVSYYRAAGLSGGKVWVVAGDTDLGGHSTVYVYSEVSKKFHHLNSTYGRYLPSKISKYKTHDDAENGKDKIGIKKVWCSYNDLVARSNFNKKVIGDLIIEEEK